MGESLWYILFFQRKITCVLFRNRNQPTSCSFWHNEVRKRTKTSTRGSILTNNKKTPQSTKACTKLEYQSQGMEEQLDQGSSHLKSFFLYLVEDVTRTPLATGVHWSSMRNTGLAGRRREAMATSARATCERRVRRFSKAW